jgi:TM2 domain-containing membrane protein YozV
MNDEHYPEENAVPTAPEPPKPPKPPVPKPPEPTPPEPEPAEAVETWSPDPDEVVDDAPPKSPVAAALLSLVPFGLGHLYLGQYSRALAFFVGFWAPIILLEFPLLLFGIFIYFFAIFDAFRQAQLINLAEKEGHDLPAGPFKGGLAAGVFLIVLGGVLLCRNWIDFYYVREFLHDWWPAILVLIGAYFIYGAVKENRQSGEIDDLEDF